MGAETTDVPPEVIAAARILEAWAVKHGVEPWKSAAMASGDELQRTAARYAVARELGTPVWYEAWAGPRERLAQYAEFDRICDANIAERARLTLGEIVNVAKTLPKAPG